MSGEPPADDWSYMVASAGAEVSPCGSPRRVDESGRRRGFAVASWESRDVVAERSGKGSVAAGVFAIWLIDAMGGGKRIQTAELGLVLEDKKLLDFKSCRDWSTGKRRKGAGFRHCRRQDLQVLSSGPFTKLTVSKTVLLSSAMT